MRRYSAKDRVFVVVKWKGLSLNGVEIGSGRGYSNGAVDHESAWELILGSCQDFLQPTSHR